MGIQQALLMVSAGAAPDPLSGTVSPSSASGFAFDFGGGNNIITDNTVTCTASGGSGGYTYSWSRVSGSTDITATNPSSATTAFQAYLSGNTSRSAVFRCTINDSASNGPLAASPDVSVYIESLA